MWIPQCAQCFLHFWRYNNIPWKPVCHWDFDILMWLLPSWCDFLPTRCYMGLMWLLPNWCDLNPSLVLRKKLVGPLLFGGKRKMCGSDMSSQAASARGMPVSTRRSLLLFSSLLTATMWLWFLLKVNLFLHLGSKKLWTSSSTFLVLDGPILKKLYSFGSYCVFCKRFLSFVSTEEKNITTCNPRVLPLFTPSPSWFHPMFVLVGLSNLKLLLLLVVSS